MWLSIRQLLSIELEPQKTAQIKVANDKTRKDSEQDLLAVVDSVKKAWNRA